ncbi:mechanosensitive ion channel family protein [Salinimonas chungwhensis]|uniref:mechanosensitive ion channel family protein n=1 Tax=Salinimonas chungwhensis TaxID=265425 RepID=UPI000365C820|nr:mechanosensitive ion channel family protein [Salinimonas chungwhensis]
MDLSESARDLFLTVIHKLLPSVTPDDPLFNLIATGTIVLAAMAIYLPIRIVFRLYIERLVKRTRSGWDDALYRHGFFRRLVHLVPALIIFSFTPVLIQEESAFFGLLIKLSLLYMMMVALLAIFAVLSTLEDMYNASYLANRAPITGFIQVAKLIFTIIVLLSCVSIIIERNPLFILSGVTALAAVLLLIFRDTILGFVAGIQIAANRMFKNGDWIQITKFEVDGEIREIGLTNVKVQNWDMTISTLPTYSLTNEAVRNWRGMQESGGRRIKRAIHIDIHSVRLCDKAMLSRFAKIRRLTDYINGKMEELRAYHKDENIDETDLLNSRKLTNIGTFRAYLTAYLNQHPKVNHTMTIMVRQLPPTELGIPLELYCFCTEKAWVDYESIQAEIFDHVMAMLDLFDLRAYQRDSHLLAWNANRAMPAKQLDQYKMTDEPDKQKSDA